MNFKQYQAHIKRLVDRHYAYIKEIKRDQELAQELIDKLKRDIIEYNLMAKQPEGKI